MSTGEAIDMLVSVIATDSQAIKKWRGYYNSLSNEELLKEWKASW